MFDWFSKIVALLPVELKFVGLAAMIGLLTGGAIAEGVGIYTQVEENSGSIESLDITVDDVEGKVTEMNAKLDMVLCILVLGEDISPLTCAPGERE